MNPAIVSSSVASTATAPAVAPTVDPGNALLAPVTEPGAGTANTGSLGSPSAPSTSSTWALRRMGGSTLIAELPALRGSTLVRSWNRGVIRQMEQRNPARRAVPAMRTPSGSAGGVVLRGLFPPGAVIVRTSASRTPPLQGYRPTGESLSAVESAFTPQRINAFGALGAEQKLLARSLLADRLPRLQAGTISEAEFDVGVGLVLQSAQTYTPPVVAARAAPINRATPPASRPVVGRTPQGTRAVDATPAQAVVRAEPVSRALLLPPERPPNHDITKVPPAQVAAALDTFESNGYPVSNPTYAAPADALFETTLKALDRLGSRSLR